MSSPNQAYQLFIDEVPELLQEIETGLLNLQEDRSTAKVHGIMRAAHSLKGGAASVGLTIIKNIAHQLEDYLKALYNENLVVDTELENLFLEAYDCLAIPLVQQMETGDFDRQEALDKIKVVEVKLAEKLGKALQQVENYLPSSADLGIDIIESLFEVDVAQEMRRLKALVSSPDSFDLEQELEESLTVLNGLSEVAELPGFSILIGISEQAFENHPDKTIVIASLLLNDLQISRDAVLAGDRTEGGNPCSNLLALAEDIQADIDDSSVNKIMKEQRTTLTVNDPVYQFFIAEVPDLLHTLETALLSIKQDKSISNVNDIMRAAHSIKGGAASVGLDGIKTMAHKLEDYIKVLFDDTVIVDDHLEDDFLGGFDCLRNALSEQIENGNYRLQWQEEAEVIWKRLDERFADLDNDNADYLPSSSDLGIDIIQSLFEVDVTHTIAELEKNYQVLPTEELLPFLTQQLEIISGFAEISSLPGLKQIAQTASKAIVCNPEKATEISQVLIGDLTAAQQEVLNGDRTVGGEPSEALLELAQITAEMEQGVDTPEDLMDLVEAVEGDEENPLEENLQLDTPETSDTNVDFTQLVSELNALDEQISVNDDSKYTLSGIPDSTDFADLGDFAESELNNTSILDASNLDEDISGELIELPESHLFTDNAGTADMFKNRFSSGAGENPVTAINYFKDTSTSDISDDNERNISAILQLLFSSVIFR